MKRSFFRYLILLVIFCQLSLDCHHEGAFHFTDNDLLQHLLREKDQYEIQIRYTQIERDVHNRPTFTSHNFNVQNDVYFYPASTVKMPVAFLALQKLNEINKEKNITLPLQVVMHHKASASNQTEVIWDSITNAAPTLENYVLQTFVVSDNNAYNRLFEFLGTDYINRELHKKKVFRQSRIYHRVGVSGFNQNNQQHTNQVDLINDGKVVYVSEPKKGKFTSTKKIKNQLKGKAYYNSNDSLINQPFDFSHKNFINIMDLEACMKRVLFPEVYPKDQQFDLSDDAYRLLYRAMRSYPKELSYYQNDTSLYDTYVKFYLGPKNVKIKNGLYVLNKIGMAYGYLTDCSYIFDVNTGMEFLLTATIHVNKDGIFNDDEYEYENIGLPFFEALGKEIMAYDVRRKRKYKADFSNFLLP